MNLKKGRVESVLVIDDRESILEVLRIILEAEGYTVYTAANPRRGIEIYRQHWPQIKLVLLDYAMPEMNGDEVFNHLSHICDDVQVCLVTSQTKEEVQHILDGGARCHIRKPFRVEEIVQCAEMVGSVPHQ